MADDGTPLPRSQFPVTERYSYFDHAGIGVLPRVALDAMAEAATELAAGGSAAIGVWEDRQEEVRASCARLMGVPTGDVAFVKNTTEGLAFVAGGLDWAAGDRVLVPEHEFPSTVYPFVALRDRGVVIELLPTVGEGRTVPLEVFEEALATGPARLVVVSWVQFGRAWRTDLAGLADLCHAHGALLCVDAIQGLGVLPADFAAWGVDMATADAHKWMLGPLGIGVLYVADAARSPLRPLEPGWASVAHREEWDNLELVFDDDARRFEGGSTNLITLAGMGAAVELLLDAGVDRVWSHVDRLNDRLAIGLAGAGATVLSDRSPAGRSGHLTFAPPRGVEPDAAVDALAGRGIVCSPRGGGVRVGPHGYTTADEVDALADAVAGLR